MNRNDDGVFIMPERELLEVFINEGGGITIKQWRQYSQDDPAFVALAPDQVRGVCDALITLALELAEEAAAGKE